MIAVEGNIPAVTMIVPAYERPGQWLLISIIYPTRATVEPPMMNGALRFVFSANTATVIVVMKATTYGGIESNWA
jgi:hypothetical protein